MSKEDTQFKEGNPGGPGRPPGSRNIETIFRDAIKKVGMDQNIEDVERELIITLLAKAKKGDMRAMEMYLDRLYGKPKEQQTIQIANQNVLIQLPPLQLPDTSSNS